MGVQYNNILNVPGKKSRNFICLGKDNNVTRPHISQDVQPTENYLYLTQPLLIDKLESCLNLMNYDVSTAEHYYTPITFLLSYKLRHPNKSSG